MRPDRLISRDGLGYYRGLRTSRPRLSGWV